MKFFYVFLLVIFSSFYIYGKKDTLHIHYFPNGEVSTICFLNEDNQGKALAYNFKGEVIYEKHIRRKYGSASVHFSHHKNGIVYKANYSSYPDAGIQRYYTYTIFNKKGELISEVEENYEGPGRVPKIVVPPSTKHKKEKEKKTDPIHKEKKPTQPERRKTPKKEVITCASIHKNHVEVINHTKTEIEITFIYQNKDTIIDLKPGETCKGPTYISAEISSPVHQNITFRFVPKRKRKNVVELIKTKQIEQYKTKHTIHLVESSIEKD